MLCQYNNIYKRKKKVQTKDPPKKKKVTTVATMPPSTVATVQNLKNKNKNKKIKKVPHQNCTVDEQWQNTAFYIVNRSMVIANPKNHTNMYSN